jgi:hypothetical protein
MHLRWRLPSLTICIYEIAVASDNDDELAVLTREIADMAIYVRDQTVLIEVLEEDGHDVSECQRELARERSHLATRIARQFRLLEITSAHEGNEPVSPTQ